MHASNVDQNTTFGTALHRLYQGYLGSIAIASVFNCVFSEDLLRKYLQDKKTLRILEIGAGAGIVGLCVKNFLEQLGFEIHLILSDRILAGLSEAKKFLELEGVTNVSFLAFDNKHIPLDDGVVDIVIARSVIHYEADDRAELRVIGEILRILKPFGFFINQFPFLDSIEEVKVVRETMMLIDRELNFKVKADNMALLTQVFGERVVYQANVQPPAIYQTSEDFIKRFKLDSPDILIDAVIEKIRAVPESKRRWLYSRNNWFAWHIQFSLVYCQKVVRLNFTKPFG